jgi:hypothetical protein
VWQSAREVGVGRVWRREWKVESSSVEEDGGVVEVDLRVARVSCRDVGSREEARSGLLVMDDSEIVE